MKLLGVSTSTARGSVAVLVDGALRGEVRSFDLQAHAERIFEGLDAVLAAAGLAPSDLTALACDIGPGSFTGVRVGVASIKGIALSLRLPVAPVVSLAAMAARARASGDAAPGALVVATVDAKKSELFVAAYASDREILAPRLVAAEADPFAELVAEARRLSHGGPVVFVGPVPGGLPPAIGTLVANEELHLPDAAWIARLGEAAVGKGGLPGVADIEPLYVRPPDAKPAS